MQNLLYAEDGTLLYLDLEKGKAVANILVLLGCPSYSWYLSFH